MDVAMQKIGDDLDIYLVALIDRYVAPDLPREHVLAMVTFAMLDYGTVVAKARGATIDQIIERIRTTYARPL